MFVSIFVWNIAYSLSLPQCLGGKEAGWLETCLCNGVLLSCSNLWVFISKFTKTTPQKLRKIYKKAKKAGEVGLKVCEVSVLVVILNCLLSILCVHLQGIMTLYHLNPLVRSRQSTMWSLNLTHPVVTMTIPLVPVTTTPRTTPTPTLLVVKPKTTPMATPLVTMSRTTPLVSMSVIAPVMLQLVRMIRWPLMPTTGTVVHLTTPTHLREVGTQVEAHLTREADTQVEAHLTMPTPPRRGGVTTVVDIQTTVMMIMDHPIMAGTITPLPPPPTIIAMVTTITMGITMATGIGIAVVAVITVMVEEGVPIVPGTPRPPPPPTSHLPPQSTGTAPPTATPTSHTHLPRLSSQNTGLSNVSSIFWG